MQIVFFGTEGWESDKLQALRGEHEVHCTPEPLTAENAQQFADADIVSPFVHCKLDASVLQQFRQLKYIATRSTGFDHIDLTFCNAHGIVASNVPVYGTNTVAEHTFALLLAISHHIPKAVSETRSGDFSGSGLRGFDLHGKTLGVIGTGNIGKRVAEIGRGFGMRVLAFDIAPDETFAQQQSLNYVSMDTLLQQSDCISLHVPGGEATQRLLATEQFAQMKKGVVVINTARGSVIDVKALLQALDAGTVAAAGIDVLPEESTMKSAAGLKTALAASTDNRDALLDNQALLDRENVIITPHSAYNTTEAVARILQTTIENITNFIAGQQQNTITDD